jgi:hypothetical protein
MYIDWSRVSVRYRSPDPLSSKPVLSVDADPMTQMRREQSPLRPSVVLRKLAHHAQILPAGNLPPPEFRRGSSMDFRLGERFKS